LLVDHVPDLDRQIQEPEGLHLRRCRCGDAQ
jgi:hypothetical protein